MPAPCRVRGCARRSVDGPRAMATRPTALHWGSEPRRPRRPSAASPLWGGSAVAAAPAAPPRPPPSSAKPCQERKVAGPRRIWRQGLVLPFGVGGGCGCEWGWWVMVVDGTARVRVRWASARVRTATGDCCDRGVAASRNRGTVGRATWGGGGGSLTRRPRAHCCGTRGSGSGLFHGSRRSGLSGREHRGQGSRVARPTPRRGGQQSMWRPAGWGGGVEGTRQQGGATGGRSPVDRPGRGTGQHRRHCLPVERAAQGSPPWAAAHGLVARHVSHNAKAPQKEQGMGAAPDEACPLAQMQGQ